MRTFHDMEKSRSDVQPEKGFTIEVVVLTGVADDDVLEEISVRHCEVTF